MRKFRPKFVRTAGEPPPLFSGVLVLTSSAFYHLAREPAPGFCVNVIWWRALTLSRRLLSPHQHQCRPQELAYRAGKHLYP